MTKVVAGCIDEQATLLARAQEQGENGDFLAAEATCSAALRLCPNASAYTMMGAILLRLARADEAIAQFNEALRLEPSSADTYKKLGRAYAALGRMDDATTAFRDALELDAGHVDALSHLSKIKHFSSAHDADLIALEALLDAGSLSQGERQIALFALAKAYEDLEDYDRSFVSLQEANELGRRAIEYDHRAALQELSLIRDVFSAELLDRLAGAGSTSELPVLIVGMPRSGSTLVEQIIASHPSVHAGGERPDLTETVMVSSLTSDGQIAFPETLKQAPRDDLLGFGEGYARRLSDLNPAATRVTDKTLRNFRYLGLVHLLLPNAKVVHCVRDPVDTCFSCYALNLVAQPYTYDLAELAEYYRAYSQLMDHWKSVLPAGWMLEVRYEDLVADIEGGARRLLEHCGLGWDDACLRFHELDRPVLTSSLAQVRRPVYQSSVSRWRRYEKHLEEFAASLGAGVELTREA